MKCYKCKEVMKGKRAYFKSKPICPICWYQRFPEKKKVSIIMQEWVRKYTR